MKNDLYIISKNRKLLFGCSAIMVFILHMWICLFNDKSYIGYLEFTIKSFGNYGVDIFIILSGLGCYYSLCKNTTKKFYINRIKRIGFAFIVVTLINNILEHNSLIEFIKNITLYSFIFENVYKNSWFSCAIILLYIFSPLYYIFFQKAKNKTKFSILSITIALLILSIISNIIRPDFAIFIKRIPEFLIGIWLGWFINNRNFSMNKKFKYMTTFILIIAWVIETSMSLSSIFIFIINSTLTTMIGVCLTIKMSCILDKIKNKKIICFLSFCGGLSYEIYRVQEFKPYYSLLAIFLPNKIEISFVAFIIKIFINMLSFIIVILLGYILNEINKIIIQTIDKNISVLAIKRKRICKD